MTVGFPSPSIRSAPQYGPQLATPSFLSQVPSALGSRPPLGELSPAGNSLPSLPLLFPLGSPIGSSTGAGSLLPVGNSMGLPNILADLFPHNPQHFGYSLPMGGFRSMRFPMDGFSSMKPALFPTELTSGGNALPGMGLPRPLTDLFPLMRSPFEKATLLPPMVGQAEFAQTQPTAPPPQPVNPPPQPVTQPPPQPQPVTQTPVAPPVTPPVTPPVAPRPPRELSDQPPLTQDQTNTLNLFKGIAERQSVTPPEKKQVLDVFRGAALDKETMEEIKDISENLAALVFSDPAFTAAITDWPNYNTEQRKEIMNDFVNKASDYLGINPSLEFFSTPAVNGTFEGGFFDGSTNSISMNTIPESTGSLSSTLQVLMHELIHAFKHDQFEGLSPAEIVRRTSDGTMSYTDALISFANMVGISYSFPDVSFDDYQKNMHERAAFTGEHFWQQAAKQYGLTPERETFTADHPLYKDLVAAGVA